MPRIRLLSRPLLRLVTLAGLALCAASAARATPSDTMVRTLVTSAKFQRAKAALASDYDRIVSDIVTLTEIPAPSFHEAARGEQFAALLRQAGLTQVTIDPVGNVVGLRRGTGSGPILVVAAHLDSVFPPGTPVAVKRQGEKLYSPGIGDDAASLALLVGFVRAMGVAGYNTKEDILFVGDVGEEGPGNLRGVRYLFEKSAFRDRIAQFISFEPDHVDDITISGVGSKRYEVTFTGPGGHSYEAFGLVNPAYALAGAVARIGAMTPPTRPKTTINVGLLSGGTSVNAIPAEMRMDVDIRSEAADELAKIDAAFLATLPEAVAAENNARATTAGRIGYEVKPTGDRPVGATPVDASTVQLAVAAARVSGFNPAFSASSTDSNLPMSRHVPAITLGSGFTVDRTHSLDEVLTLDRPNDVKQMAVGLATILLLAHAH